MDGIEIFKIIRFMEVTSGGSEVAAYYLTLTLNLLAPTTVGARINP